MDTRFSIAIHMLILISEADSPLSSAQIAQSVGVNASHIRKIGSCLKKAGLISSSQGIRGFALSKAPRAISLMDVYEAIYGIGSPKLFPMHKNANDKCIVGRHIQPTLESAFAGVSEEAANALKSLSLADVISDMRSRVEEESR